LFSSYINQTSPASIRIEQTKYGNDSMHANVIVKTEATHALGNLKLFVALAEDTIFYNAPNGETQHYDVFRKSLGGSSGVSLNLPANVGDSLVFSFSSNSNSSWNFARIFTIAILQEETSKMVVQTEAAPANQNNLTTALAASFSMENSINVNTFENGILVTQKEFMDFRNIRLFDLSGKEIMNRRLSSPIEKIGLSQLPRGIYLYEISLQGTICQSGKVFLN
jgi:hypothetical protein